MRVCREKKTARDVLQPPHSWLSCNPEQHFHFPVITYIDFFFLFVLYSLTCSCLCSKHQVLIGVCAPVQVELTGSSVFDYIHPADHVEMAERLGIKPHLRAEAGCHGAPDSASSTASTSSLAGTPEPGTYFFSL